MGKKRRIKELERRVQDLEVTIELLKSLGVELPTTTTIDVEPVAFAPDQLLSIEDAMGGVEE